MDFSDEESGPVKLPKIDSEDRLYVEEEEEKIDSNGSEKPPEPNKPPEPVVPAINPQVQAAILAAKAKIESQIPTTDLIGTLYCIR